MDYPLESQWWTKCGAPCGHSLASARQSSRFFNRRARRRGADRLWTENDESWFESELLRLLNNSVHRISLGRLDPEVALALGCTTSETIVLSRGSLLHIIWGHDDLRSADLGQIPDLLKDALVVRDDNKPNTAIYCYQSREMGRRYIGVLKAVRGDSDVYMVSFHRARKRNTKSILERGPKLRSHK